MELHLGVLPGQYKTGETFSDVMEWNHYGTETIPPRPVLRIAAENIAGAFFKERLEAYLENILHNPAGAKHAEVVFLQDMGRQTAAEAKRIIKGSSGLQHNAPSTVKKKGFDKPLFETGELMKHISYEVEADNE